MNEALDRLWRDERSRLATLWRVDLTGVSVEWSSRMTRSLGLCYPRKARIRISARLADGAMAEVLRETLVHEAAHVAAWRLGHRGRPHAEPWRWLMRLAGASDRASCRDAGWAPSPRPPRVRLECRDCGTAFLRRRSDRRWRCRRCLQRGLGGRLKVTRLQG